ncbi:beta-lactamase family protein [Stenotrophomonas sp. GD03908]|uniref:Serine hydrolase domain-containing protein n=1 Tax=Stenotrophomonas maltophilia TaxID=40324 RepID=A0AAJ2WL42_STEMA|nr:MULTISPECIES: serine hydrolase domain-containing protein [Stenotrophomonas]MBH1484544.1 beta-lactamase family protein [Stenotrophomonas maltophilia]MDH0981812.1 beta-lactamase family protein [Stenotrophomonas sp. GD03908]MDQ7295017.1 serine hydrolase [Stenotrophomonas sp. Sm0041]MDZ5764369.1 serine hydrolase domain-containing protein [Stenotrophomonas maltophilia]
MNATPSFEPEPTLPSVQRLLQQVHPQRLVGAVVLVREHGVLRHASATGLADRGSATPMQRDQLFRLASVSKPLLTTVILRLVAQGVLDLDTPVQRWLPDFRPAMADGSTPPISLRQLLSHSSGLGYRFLEADADGPYARAGVSDGMDARPLNLAENVRRIAQAPLLFAPGSQWMYSLGVDVAGAVAEAATGETLQALFARLLAAPLGLRDTAFATHDASRLATPYVTDTPQPHRLREGEVVAPFEGTVGIEYSLARATDGSRFPSAGAGLVGTADEVVLVLEALRDGQHAGLLPPHLVAEMATPQVGEQGPPEPAGWGFGLGFAVLRDAAASGTPQNTGTWRWGGAYGHSWFVDPARGLSVVALTNTLYEGMDGAFVDQLRDAVYADLGTAR